jgi:hypothetical protein
MASEKESSVAKANESENRPEASATPHADSAPAAGEAASGQPQRVQIQIDYSKAATTYANFWAVKGTPEELILDFGLNPEPFGRPTQPIVVSQRVVMSFYNAKRLMSALQMSIQGYEATFGVLETDVQKRAVRK